jgi:hypothetical protein
MRPAKCLILSRAGMAEAHWGRDLEADPGIIERRERYRSSAWGPADAVAQRNQSVRSTTNFTFLRGWAKIAYHKCDETIRGHVFCSFLALVLKCELESRLRQAGVTWEWAEVIRGLDGLQQVEANLQGRRFLFRSHLQGHAAQALRVAGVAIPPTLRELA